MAGVALFEASPVGMNLLPESDVGSLQTVIVDSVVKHQLNQCHAHGPNPAAVRPCPADMGLSITNLEDDNRVDENSNLKHDRLCFSWTTCKRWAMRYGTLWRKYGLKGCSVAAEDCGAGVELQSKRRRQDGHLTLDVDVHEIPVKGTHIDDRILPGFKYRIRILSQNGRNRFQFGGEAIHLTSIGQGYGKRLTFQSEYANLNPNYFWSDTHPGGYAFTITAVEPGDEFVVCHQNHRPFGRATVINASQQQVEVNSRQDGKSVVKKVLVAMQITVQYTCEPHGMMSLRADEMVDVIGIAVVEKSAGKLKAATKCIEEVEIPGHGECLLYSKED